VWGQTDSNYDRWATFLEHWGRGEPARPEDLPALVAEELAVDAWQRLQVRLLDAMEARTTSWADALLAAMAAARDEFEVSRALAQSRLGLAAVRALSDHPGLPANLRTQLLGLVDGKIRSVQQSMEDQLRHPGAHGLDARAADTRLQTVRDNPLTAVVDAAPGQTSDGWIADMSAPSRRHIVID
jgi:hypothetical protein